MTSRQLEVKQSGGLDCFGEPQVEGSSELTLKAFISIIYINIYIYYMYNKIRFSIYVQLLPG